MQKFCSQIVNQMARGRRRVKLSKNAVDLLLAHSEMLFSEISCPKKLHEVDERSLGVALSSFAMQIDKASLWVNEKYAKIPNKARSNTFETRDLTNLSTKSRPITLNAIVPSPRFFALSESRVNKSIPLVWQEYD